MLLFLKFLAYLLHKIILCKSISNLNCIIHCFVRCCSMSFDNRFLNTKKNCSAFIVVIKLWLKSANKCLFALYNHLNGCYFWVSDAPAAALLISSNTTFAVPSIDLRSTFPANPSHTTTSALPSNTSLPSILPVKLKPHFSKSS